MDACWGSGNGHKWQQYTVPPKFVFTLADVALHLEFAPVPGVAVRFPVNVNSRVENVGQLERSCMLAFHWWELHTSACDLGIIVVILIIIVIVIIVIVMVMGIGSLPCWTAHSP